MVGRTSPRLWRGRGLVMVGLVLGWLSPLPLQAQLTPLEPPPEHPIQPDLSALSLVRAYDLGPLNLDQSALSPAFPAMPVALTGGIAVPPGPGPFPWVLVLHGRHAGCHLQPAAERSQWPCPPDAEPRYDLGFAYLAQGLAEAGFGVLLVNLNGAFSNTYGAAGDNANRLIEQRSLQIIDAHLQRLAAAQRGASNGFGVALQGKVDLNRVAMVGHSMGGGMAALSALERQTKTDAPHRQTGQGAIASLLLLSPTRSENMADRPDAYALPDVPTSVVIGSCDRDIFDFSSLFYFETAVQHPDRRAPAATVLLVGANHNFFNRTVPKDDYYLRPGNGTFCDPQRSSQRLSRLKQESFLLAYVRDFFALTLGTTQPENRLMALGLLANRATPAQLYGQPVLLNLDLPAATKQPIFQAALPDPTSTTITMDGVIPEVCDAFSPCRRAPRHHPQFPAVLVMRWLAPGSRVAFSLHSGPLDVSQFDSLQVRLAPEPAFGAEPLGFAVVLRDQDGQAVRVEIPPTTPALQSLVQPSAQPQDTGPVYPSSLRIPLPQLSGVDLSAITAVELVFDQTAPGGIYLASLEFIGQPGMDSWTVVNLRAAPASVASEF
jgi:dienelactone hydrolase